MSKYSESKEVSRVVARIHASVLAFVFAVIGGMSIFVMTVWLLIKGGENIGYHLQLLSQYFIGYSVTWKGSIVGLFYGALIGGIFGWSIGWIYNLIVGIRRR